jgi:hypothetical protein
MRSWSSDQRVSIDGAAQGPRAKWPANAYGGDEVGFEENWGLSAGHGHFGKFVTKSEHAQKIHNLLSDGSKRAIAEPNRRFAYPSRGNACSEIVTR